MKVDYEVQGLLKTAGNYRKMATNAADPAFWIRSAERVEKEAHEIRKSRKNK